MKNSILTTALVLLSLAIQSQPILTIEFKDISTGKILLFNTQKETMDTVIITNGIANYETTLESPTLFYYFVEGYNTSRPLELVLSNQNTEMRFDRYKVSNGKSIHDAYPNSPIFVSDPNRNAAFYEFLTTWKDFYTTIQKLSENDSPEQLERRKNTYETFLSQTNQIIRDNKNQYISAIIIAFLLKNNLLQMETLQAYYDELNPSVKESYMGLKIGEKAGKAGRLQSGQPAPAFELTDNTGKNYHNESLIGKNVLLHFWSSSCAPCIKEAPDLLKLSNKYADNLIVINIALDIDRENWSKGITKAGIDEMINVCDLQGLNSPIAKAFETTFVPAYYLIDTQGMISLKGTIGQVVEKIKDGIP